MNPLTEKQIRTSFVNCSKREAAQLNLPLDLSDLRWDHLDYLGWIDRKAPLRAYVVLTVEQTLVGITLRTPEVVAARRRAMCAWCEDVNATNDASMYVARRAGASGRNGDTIGTLICTSFECSRNVRRTPTIVEAGLDPAGLVQPASRVCASGRGGSPARSCRRPEPDRAAAAVVAWRSRPRRPAG